LGSGRAVPYKKKNVRALRVVPFRRPLQESQRALPPPDTEKFPKMQVKRFVAVEAQVAGTSTDSRTARKKNSQEKKCQ
jgi:hypothetical protein